jgi:hypothetical protein
MAANTPSVTARELLLGARIAIDASYGDGTSAQNTALVAALAQAIAIQNVAAAISDAGAIVSDASHDLDNALASIANAMP